MIRARFHPEAASEFDEAAQFYESAQAGLGGAFAHEVERTGDRITAFPEAGPPLGATVRAATVSVSAGRSRR